MGTLTPADWCMVAVLAICTLQAARRGFFMEAFSLAGLVVGIGLASWNYPRLVPFFARWIHSGAVDEAVAFLTIVLGTMIVAGILGRIIRWSARTIGLGWVDRLLGAIFGLIKGAVLVTLAVMLLMAFWPESPVLHSSRLGPMFITAARESSLATPAALRDKVHDGARILHEHTPAWLER